MQTAFTTFLVIAMMWLGIVFVGPWVIRYLDRYVAWVRGKTDAR